MQKRFVLLAVSAVWLAGCSPAAPTTAPPAEAAPAEAAPAAAMTIDTTASGAACTPMTPEQLNSVDVSTLDLAGVVGGYQIMGAPGAMTCADAADHATLDCNLAAGGVAHIENADGVTAYTAPAGTAAFIQIGPTGPTCTLRN